MKKHIITLTGDIASGKDSVKDILENKLSYDVYRASKLYREKAKSMNMTITEFQDYLDTHEEEERNTEKSMGEYGETHDNLIVVARLRFFCYAFCF